MGRNRNYFLTREILPYPLYICESLEEFLRYALGGWYGHKFFGIRVLKRKKLKCRHCGRETRFVVLFYKRWSNEFWGRPEGVNSRPMCKECILRLIREGCEEIVKGFERFLNRFEAGAGV